MKTASVIVTFLFVRACSGFAPVAPTRQGKDVISLTSTVDDKTEVREYFNTEGFNRWNKIYSESDDVNSVQMDIRTGHDQTIQKILNWVKADGNISGKTVCDCGCGVGSLAIPLAQMGKSHCVLCSLRRECCSLLNSMSFEICHGNCIHV